MEETISGSGTNSKVNGIAIQRAFIKPLPKVNRVQIEKSKKQSTEVPMDKIYAYKADRKTDDP